MNRADLERSCCGIISSTVCKMAKEAGENHEESQDNRSSGRDLNSAAPECGAAVLTARPLRSIAYV
jgi:hypothetical protein